MLVIRFTSSVEMPWDSHKLPWVRTEKCVQWTRL